MKIDDIPEMLNSHWLRCVTLFAHLGIFGAQTVILVAEEYRLSTFSADVTPPIGHPLLGGATKSPPVKRVDDPLYARGFVLSGPQKPLVVVAVDWCEIRNDAYDRWREVLAEAAGAEPARVLVSSIHQHDAPLADLEAERMLESAGAPSKIIDLEFHEQCVQAAAQALRKGLRNSRRVTHLGTGEAHVVDVTSNRRYLGADGQPNFDRSSGSGGDPAKKNADAGTIDPVLKTLSFWDGETPLCALHVFAVHPMSYWGTGFVTSDFVGLARAKMQADHPDVFQMYASGASGNVTAGKFNHGRPETRPILIDRLQKAMEASWQATVRQPITPPAFRLQKLKFAVRNDTSFTIPDMELLLKNEDPKKQSLGAMGLSWRKRLDAGHALDLPCIDFGGACLLLLPGESYVEFQLFAQQQRPDAFVVTMGYGECGPGYVPIERAWEERDGNLFPWCWVGPGAEHVMQAGIRRALGKQAE